MQNNPEIQFNDIVVYITAWSRPSVTYQLLQQLRKVAPPVLLIQCDGPRPNIIGDKTKVNLVRDIFEREIDWDCKIYRKYLDVNVGMLEVCGKGEFTTNNGEIYEFNNDSRMIYLEDDDLPSVDFFKFCIEMLEKYNDNDNVWWISGNNFQYGITRGKASYYFSYQSHGWGCARWYRKDIDFEKKHSQLKDAFDKIEKGELHFPKGVPDYIKNYIMMQCRRVYYGDLKYVTDDFLRNLYVYLYDKFTVIPNVNLVQNIGFSPVDGTNCLNPNSILSVETKPMKFPLIHPDKVVVDTEADEFYYKKVTNMH